MREVKTNVMRLIEQKKIEYKSHCYIGTGAVSGIEVAEVLNQNPERTFKTLVTEGKSKEHYVFIISFIYIAGAYIVGNRGFIRCRFRDFDIFTQKNKIGRAHV